MISYFPFVFYCTVKAQGGGASGGANGATPVGLTPPQPGAVTLPIKTDAECVVLACQACIDEPGCKLCVSNIEAYYSAMTKNALLAPSTKCVSKRALCEAVPPNEFSLQFDKINYKDILSKDKDFNYQTRITTKSVFNELSPSLQADFCSTHTFLSVETLAITDCNVCITKKAKWCYNYLYYSHTSQLPPDHETLKERSLIFGYCLFPTAGQKLEDLQCKDIFGELRMYWAGALSFRNRPGPEATTKEVCARNFSIHPMITSTLFTTIITVFVVFLLL